MNKYLTLLALVVCSSAGNLGIASEAIVQTPSPVVHLKDNLDEADNLGWCIDTVGRGFAKSLHAHSCKPQGGDVQFSFDETTGQISSVPYEEQCVVVRAQSDETHFGLDECSPDNQKQRFSFDSDSGQISPVNSPTKCVVVGENSRSAGPFMSRNLLLTECNEVEAIFRTWVMR